MIASLLFRWHYRRFQSACDNPRAAQANRLRQILRASARTSFGQAHGLGRLARVADDGALITAFQEQVPIRTYAEMRQDLDAVYAGDWQRLCPSRPVYFSMTAGSTGKFKFVPVTAEYRQELRRGSLIYYGAMESVCPAMRRLQTQFLVGSAEGGRSPTGIPQGFASGFNYRNLPRLIRGKFILPYWIFTLANAEDRAYAAGRILVSHPNLGALCAISPVNLINLKRALETHAERLFEDIETGSLTVESAAAVPGSYAGRPDPGLAATLRDAWRRDRALPARLLFPSLELLICWQGGNMSYYLKELGRNFDHQPCLEFPLSASEGLFAVPHRANEAGGIIAITSHFLEFVPESRGLPRHAALTADQLQVGACYRVIVTNSSGLYRYDMEDIIRVTGFFRGTPVIAFVSKTDRHVSVSNERLSECDVTVAMQAASESAGVWFEEFLFVPCTDRRYRVVIDGGAQRPAAGAAWRSRLEHLAGNVERELRRASTGYDFEREDGLLEPLALLVTAPGELRAYLARRQPPHGLPNAQVKPMHLTRDLDAHREFHAEAISAA